MRKLLFFFFFVPTILLAQTATTTSGALPILQNIIDTDRRPEIMVNKDGVMTLRNAKIMQIAGTTLFTRVNWGEMYLRITIKTTADTKFYRRYGEATTRAELKEGDYLNIEGVLESGGNTFGLTARSIVNLAVLKETNIFSGNIGGVMPESNAFIVFTSKYGPVRVNVGEAKITKGSLTITVPWLKAGEKVLSVSGEYNHADKTLAATAVKVFVDLKPFKPRNYTATIATIDSPTALTVLSEGKPYVVALNGSTVLKNKARNSVPLKRFVEGDDLIIYGATSESATTTITAEVIRNLSL